MAFRRLAGLQLADEWKKKLAAHKLETTRDVVSRTDMELSELLDVSIDDAQALTAAVAAQVTEAPRSAYDMLLAATSGPALSLCASVAALRVVAGLTELVGPAGVGKSQCCFTLAVAAYVAANELSGERAVPVPSSSGTSQHVVWVDTEGTFSSQRVVQIAQAAHPAVFGSPDAVTALLSHLLVLPAAGPDALSAVLSRLEELLVCHPAALLVVDSIAAPVRAHYSRHELTKRAEWLGGVAGQLKYVSERYGLPCVVTNQVRGGGGAAGDGLTAALGVTWAHAVNVRWVLEDEVGGGGRRRVRVAKTPMHRGVSYGFVVDEGGVVVGERVVGEEESWDVMRMTMRRELEGGVEAEVEEGGGGGGGSGAGKGGRAFYDDEDETTGGEEGMNE